MGVPLYQVTADFFRTLGHPARIRVLELLAEHERGAHELLEQVPIEPGNLSQQLAVLRRAGLVEQRREGGSVVYAIRVPEVGRLLVSARSVLADVVPEAAQPGAVH